MTVLPTIKLPAFITFAKKILDPTNTLLVDASKLNAFTLSGQLISQLESIQPQDTVIIATSLEEKQEEKSPIESTPSVKEGKQEEITIPIEKLEEKITKLPETPPVVESKQEDKENKKEVKEGKKTKEVSANVELRSPICTVLGHVDAGKTR